MCTSLYDCVGYFITNRNVGQNAPSTERFSFGGEVIIVKERVEKELQQLRQRQRELALDYQRIAHQIDVLERVLGIKSDKED